ncbi:hypothetical protein BKA25_004805 [Actinoalloteichus hymeniacidonis]|uniref:Uncharacterized protein n=1 Tax=Actinoalloteichus hymeniacidonis TaxID=340345 RepID=A0AAC9HLV6_9PSEU|nr:hypothetical protein TL08_03355 [Actinoalloteichus hymeniacidonis]MBB5910489.1 hypothetical protein [Actinoalloteichus hymeniacidonis]
MLADVDQLCCSVGGAVPRSARVVAVAELVQALRLPPYGQRDSLRESS